MLRRGVRAPRWEHRFRQSIRRAAAPLVAAPRSNAHGDRPWRPIRKVLKIIMKRSFVLGLLASLGVSLAVWACSGEGEACNDIGCGSGVGLTFSPAITAPGRFVFDVEDSNANGSCEVTLPLGNSVTCGNLTVEANPSGGVSQVTSAATSSLTIRVQRDGELIASVPLQPAFRDTGEGLGSCSENCLQANEVINLQ
jgi:hypothetical protein